MYSSEVLEKSKLNSISPRALKSILLIYLLFSLQMALVAIFHLPGIISTIVLVMTTALGLLLIRDLFYLSFYFLLLQINSYFVQGAIIGTSGITLGHTINLLFIIFFFLLLLKKQKKISVQIVPSTILVFWLTYTTIILFWKSSFSITYSVIFLSYFIVSVFFQNLVVRDKKYCELLITIYFIAITIITLFWFIEIIRGETFFSSQWTLTERYRSGFLRAGSTVGDNNIASALVGVALFLFQTKAFKKIIGINLIRIVSCLILFMLVFSFSRSAWVALAICSAFVIISKYKLILLPLVPLIGIITGYISSIVIDLMQLDIASSTTRGNVNNLSFSLWIDNFWTGIGFGNYQHYSYLITNSDIVNAYNTINTYYYILVTSGTIGLLFFILFIGYTCRYSITKIFSKNSDHRYIVAGIFFWLIAIYNFDSFTNIFFWILPAVVLSIHILGSDILEEKSNFIKV